MNRFTSWLSISSVLALVLVAACSDKKPSTPTSSSSNPTPTPATVVSVTVSGIPQLTTQGQTAQLTATAALSDGTSENRTSSATWASADTAVATVSAQGVVTAVATGETAITASVAGIRGSRGVSVKLSTPAPTSRRTPDPAAGQKLPLPDVQAFLQQKFNERRDLLAQSCPTGRKYETNPWLNYMVDSLRTLDTRWGYNGKPNRGPSDNSGFPVICAGDEIAYHYGRGEDQGSTEVYLIDILLGHCGDNPQLTFRHFTGEEPGFWTGAGRLPSGNGFTPMVLLERPEGLK